MNETYKIPEQNLDRVRDILAKLNRKAVRLGVPEVAWLKSDRYHEVREERDDHGEKRIEVRWYVDVDVNGEEVKLDGWHLLARVVHLSQEGNLLETVPGHTVPERFRTADPLCDHCNTVRWRKDTFLVEHDDGTVKQVGSSCLHDFLGHDPHRLVAYQRWLVELETGLREDGGSGGSWERSVPLSLFLSCTATQIKLYGYRSSTKCREEQHGEPTGSYVFRLLTTPWESLPQEEREELDKFRAKQTELDGLTCATLCWLGSLFDKNDLSDYLHNLKVAASIGWVT